VVGNVLGVRGFLTVYQKANGEPGVPTERVIYQLGYRNGYGCSQPPFDDLVTLDVLRHGNWDAATESVKWEPDIPGRELPASLYLKAKPSWFGDLPWPVFGPDVAGLAGKLPAEVHLWGPDGGPDMVPSPEWMK